MRSKDPLLPPQLSRQAPGGVDALVAGDAPSAGPAPARAHDPEAVADVVSLSARTTAPPPNASPPHDEGRLTRARGHAGVGTRKGCFSRNATRPAAMPLGFMYCSP